MQGSLQSLSIFRLRPVNFYGTLRIIQTRRSSFDDDPYLDVIIDDFGPGIPDDRKDQVLRRKEARITTASGLGLTLVSDIIHQYHGRVWIEDRVKANSGLGTRVVIRFPKINE